MPTFKPCIRKERADGFCAVYIRVRHNNAIGYIKTDKVTRKVDLSPSGEIQDPYVLRHCLDKIIEYTDKLNKYNISSWSVQDVIAFLLNDDKDICFSEYARNVHIPAMINRGQERNSRNYALALQHLERFMGTNKIMFSHLTSHVVNRWIQHLKSTRRAKEMYPICMRQIFKAAQLEYNDYDNGIIRIKTNPWVKVSIPSSDKAEKLAITPEACRAFFSYPIPDSKMKVPLMEFGRDVAMMVLCLAGINTVDLYNLRKKDYKNGIICYQRAKTKKFRADGAYMEMRVPPILQPLMDKYLDRTNSEWLFTWRDRLSNSDSFNANVNVGIRQLCQLMGIRDTYCVYTFRHTWGTVAQNDVRASISDVAFAMNHSSGHKVTRGYIKIDYSPAWELNEKVIDFIFFSGKTSTREQKQEDVHFRLSYRYMVNAAAYFNGQNVAELTDVGFNNVDEVIARLVAMLPEDIPTRSIVMFKIVNLDKNQTVVYQKQKGKGF
ncbi:MAG: phage integrase SAM-like domain-containing protein [Paludibacteraceae bacterium]|nr:phage integrase SAM-like domain-containing protein [Paludibacteraceae bacterium]